MLCCLCDEVDATITLTTLFGSPSLEAVSLKQID